jgi:hypothetical protein
MAPPRDPSIIKDARGWGWTALCAGHLAGHFSSESIGNLWVNYIADIDRRLMENPERDARLDCTSLIGDVALFDVARLLNRAGIQGHGMWEASLIAHSIWGQIEREGMYPDQRFFDLYGGLFKVLDKHFPWALRYLAHFQIPQEVPPGIPGADMASVQESDDWTALSDLKGVRVFGEPSDLKNGFWVVCGGKNNGRPAAVPAGEIVVDLGDAAEGLENFTTGQGWRVLSRLCSSRGPQSSPEYGLVAVLQFGGETPVLIHCGRDELNPGLASGQEGISLLQDPDMMLVPAHVQDAIQTWRRMHRAGRGGGLPPMLFLANPALLAREGALQMHGKIKNST